MVEDGQQSPRQAIRAFVAQRVNGLQKSYLDPARRSLGAGRLAALRHAVSKEPGSTPDIWALEFEGMPNQLVGRGDRPSAGEQAVHTALTLYALHQQSQTVGMHAPGHEHSLGAAAKQMIAKEHAKYENLQEGEPPRRFAALITAESFSETAHYARQLVQQLRAAAIPLDYGLLAQQLYDLQNPYRADVVRLSWGRDFVQAYSHNAAEQDKQAER